MKKFIFWLSLSCFLGGVFPLKSKAISEFATSYQATYLVDTRGNTRVKQKVSLTNNFSNIYPKEYRLEIGAPAQSISAWDEKGNILSSVEGDGKTTKIRLHFNQEVVGKGKTLTFHLEYSLPGFASKKGQVWEMVLPQITNIAAIEEYQSVVEVPSSFGHLSYASVKPQVDYSKRGKIRLIFNKKQISRGIIMIAFGDFQAFDFSLFYYLNNNSRQEKVARIAIPPETNYQEVFYSQISPPPGDVDVDENGNWLAIYRLKAGEKIKVEVKGQAKILSSPRKNALYNRKENINLFLGKDRYWEVDQPQIASLAKKLKTPFKIYQYVVDHLEYSYQLDQKQKRKGALNALLKGGASVCTEFTDLFIALARAAGIPAREIEGFAYTNNPKIKPLSLKKDILHAWPEYWDQGKGEWVQVDPTWGKTTGGIDYFHHFDLNHFAFVIHGSKSSLPLPPGSYSPPGTKAKTVFVTFSQKQLFSSPKEKGEKTVSLDLQEGGRAQNEIIFKNNSLSPLKNIKITYLGRRWLIFGHPLQLPPLLSLKKPITREISLIPPLGKETFIPPQSFPWGKRLFSSQYQFILAGDNWPSPIEKNITLSSPWVFDSRMRKITAVLLLSSFLGGLVLIFQKAVARRS